MAAIMAAGGSCDRGNAAQACVTADAWAVSSSAGWVDTRRKAAVEQIAASVSRRSPPPARKARPSTSSGSSSLAAGPGSGRSSTGSCQGRPKAIAQQRLATARSKRRLPSWVSQAASRRRGEPKPANEVSSKGTCGATRRAAAAGIAGWPSASGIMPAAAIAGSIRRTAGPVSRTPSGEIRTAAKQAASPSNCPCFHEAKG